MTLVLENGFSEYGRLALAVKEDGKSGWLYLLEIESFSKFVLIKLGTIIR